MLSSGIHGYAPNCLCGNCTNVRVFSNQRQTIYTSRITSMDEYNAPFRAPAVEMTRADLGIVDQNLDDKVGMEP